MYIHINDASLNGNLGKVPTPTFGTTFCRTHHHSSLNNTALPSIPTHGPSPHKFPTQKRGACSTSIGKCGPMGVPTPSPFHLHTTSLHTPNTPNSLTLPLQWPMFGKYIHSCSLIFSHRPDELALVWRLRKLVCYKFDLFALFQHSGDIKTFISTVSLRFKTRVSLSF